jgi:hypothetical protein
MDTAVTFSGTYSMHVIPYISLLPLVAFNIQVLIIITESAEL